MPATIYYDKDADLARLDGKKVAIIGYGSQGHAHALNLRDSGVDVRVGLHAGSKSRAKAEAEGLRVLSVADAAAEADVIMVVVPDETQRQVYDESIAQQMRPGKTLMFAHGFNVHYGQIDPPAGVDVTLIAPKSPGHRLRELFTEGVGVPGLVAVHRDASGGRRRMRWPTARRSAAPGPVSSRRPSRRRPRPTSSASRRSSAAASAR